MVIAFFATTEIATFAILEIVAIELFGNSERLKKSVRGARSDFYERKMGNQYFRRTSSTLPMILTGRSSTSLAL